MVRRSFAEAAEREHFALIAALLEACEFCQRPENRERLLVGDIARQLFERVRTQAEHRGLLSDEHFTVDGTLIEAWAGVKSFQRKDTPREPPANTVTGVSVISPLVSSVSRSAPMVPSVVNVSGSHDSWLRISQPG